MEKLAALSILINAIIFLALYAEQRSDGATAAHAYAPGKHLLTRVNWLTLKARRVRYALSGSHHLRYVPGNIARTFFPIFYCAHALFPYFMWPLGTKYQWGGLTIIRGVGIILCLLLLVKNDWPHRLRSYFKAYWYFTVMYLLPFYTTLGWLITGGHMAWTTNVVFAIILLHVMVDKPRFILLGLLGMGLGTTFYHLRLVPYEDIATSYAAITSTQHLVYTCVFAIAISICFLQTRNKSEERRNALRLLGIIGTEMRKLLALRKAYGSSIQFLNEQMQIEKVLPAGDNQELLSIKVNKQSYTSLKEAIKGLIRDSKRGVRTVDRILATLQAKINTSDFTMHSMRQCVTDALEAYQLTMYQEKQLHTSLEGDFQFYGSAYYTQHMLFNLIENSHKHSQQDCTLQIRLNNHRLHVKDTGRGISKNALPYIFDPFFTTDATAMGLGLAFCKLVMQAYGGVIICKSKQGKQSFTEFILTFPKPRNHTQRIPKATKRELPAANARNVPTDVKERS